jgi:hypothetical protein
MKVHLGILENPARIRRLYRYAWGVFGVTLTANLILLALFPEDRPLLRLYLIAAIGPFLAQSYSLAFLPKLSWLGRFPLHRILLGSVTLLLIVKSLQGSRQDLYVYLMLGMGPLLLTSNLYTAIRVREECEDQKPTPR